MTRVNLKKKIHQLTDSYEEYLLEDLKNPKTAVLYLQAAIGEYQKDDKIEALLLALRHVADAQGGLAKLAKKTQLNRENLYKMLSSKGNPKLNTLSALLHALGFQLSIQVAA